MVKTRTQKQAIEDEYKRVQSIPQSALPPKVCCTPPHSARRPPAMASSLKSKSTKRKRLMFDPAPPEEFKFDMFSPPARRIQHSNHGLVHESVVRLEFEARGLEEAPVEIGDRERDTYKQWICRDLKDELKNFHGLDSGRFPDQVEELRDRLEFAETLRRRAEIRRTPQIGLIPHEMPMRDIQRELHSRRIAYGDQSYYQVCKALEMALLKEDAEGLVGEGYQFGRRFVSAADVIGFYQPSDKEMRDMLQSRAIKGKLIPKKKSQKLELLSQFVELEQVELVRNLMRTELLCEMQRRNIIAETEEYSSLFEQMYSSNRWRNNYEDIDCTSPYTPSADEQPGCVVC